MDELGSIILGSQSSDQEKGKAASNKDQFVATYTPAAQKVAQQLNVPVDAVLGHWGHETNWGKSIVPGTNNLGNIKDFSGKGVSAIDNQTKTKDKYKQYATPEDFADDYANLVANRYKGAIDTKTPYDYAAALQKGGYAEDKNFANAVSASSKNIFASSDPLGDIILNPSGATQKGVTQEQMSQPSKAAEFARTVATQGLLSPSTLLQAATSPAKAAREYLTGEKEQPLTTESVLQSVLPESVYSKLKGGAETLAHYGSTLAAAPVGAVAGIAKNISGGTYGTQAGIKAAEEEAARVQQALTYEPRTAKGKEYTQDVASMLEASKIPPYEPMAMGLSAKGVGTQAAEALPKVTEPVVVAAQKVFQKPMETMAGWREELAGAKPSVQAQFNMAKGNAPFASVGAAGVTPEARFATLLEKLPPEAQQALKGADPRKVNVDALERHVEASSLPIPIQYTEGQATRNPVSYSNELNKRGTDAAYTERFNLQGQQLKENLGAIKETVAPDVFAQGKTETGQVIFDTYKQIADDMDAATTAAYQKLYDAAGGQTPIDGVTFAKDAYARLKKELKTEYIPAEIASDLRKFANGEPMTFENFEAFRTNLAEEARSAKNGNARRAAALIRNALEDLPLAPEAAGLKNIANEARSLAKAKFDLMKSDPAFNAVVKGKIAPDDFIQKLIINGKANDLQRMVNTLGENSPAHQAMGSGTIDWLTNQAGILDGKGAFKQAGFNRGLTKIVDKLPTITGQQGAQYLKTLGNVAHNIMVEPEGAFVNKSNTWVAQAAERAPEVLAHAVNAKTMSPIGTWTLGAIRGLKSKAAKERTLGPGAGIRISDIGK